MYSPSKFDEIELLCRKKLINTVANLFQAPAAFITQANEKGIEVIVASELDSTKYKPGGSADMATNVYCHQVVQQNKPLYISNAHSESKWYDYPEYNEDSFVSYHDLPINWPNGNCFGTL